MDDVDLDAVHRGDREDVLQVLMNQAGELTAGTVQNLTCPCGNDVALRRAFRCFDCEIWFCPACAERHFRTFEQDEDSVVEITEGALGRGERTLYLGPGETHEHRDGDPSFCRVRTLPGESADERPD